MDEKFVSGCLTRDLEILTTSLAAEDLEVLSQQLVYADVIKVVRLDELNEVVQRNFALRSNQYVLYKQYLELYLFFIRDSKLVQIPQEVLNGWM